MLREVTISELVTDRISLERVAMRDLLGQLTRTLPRLTGKQLMWLAREAIMEKAKRNC